MPRPVPTTQTGSLTDNEHGTNDTLILGPGTGPSDPQIALYGDALAMYDDSRGGNDTLIGGASADNALFGDARLMFDNADGGNDTLIGGAGSINFLNADALFMYDSAHGGNDTLIGADGAVFNFFLADASDMYGNAHGGNDTLIGGANTSNPMFADAFNMFDNARGGNDTLIGGANSINNLFGDAFHMHDNARAGNDTLISSAGTDQMWGDALLINDVVASPTAPTGSVVTGTDTFVFAPGNGNDFVHDFRQTDHDRIDVSAWGFDSLADMTIIDTGGDTRIEFDATNSVTLVGFGDPGILHASDFIFA
jgi:Ca2+-binding RTX toxin-like protein